MELTNVLIIVGSNLAMMFTMFGSVVALHIQSTNQIAKINEEMKDFHGKLCSIKKDQQGG